MAENHWPHTFSDGHRCECGLRLLIIKRGETVNPVHAMIAHHHATAHMCGSGYCDECDVQIDEESGVAMTDILCAVVL